MRKEKQLNAYKKRYQTLARSLANLGFIWHGNLQRRMLPCKNTKCLCNLQHKPQHGPYPYWTTKVNQKTVTKLLSSEEANLFEKWIENRRKMETILKQMNELSKKAAKLILTDKKNTF